MKNSLTMLAVIATFLLTWCSIALFGYLLSDTSFKECMSHMATVMCMLMFGWVPCVVVGHDLSEKWGL